MNRLKTSIQLCMLAAGLITLLLAAEVADAAPLTCGTWSVVASPNAGSSGNVLNGVAVVSASNVWAVGYYFSKFGLNTLTLIEHWNGTKWSVIASPNTGSNYNNLYGVAAVSANNVWAVGEFHSYSGNQQTLIEHWNGTKWSIVASPNTGSNYNNLYGVAAVSANNVWAVGFYFNKGSLNEQTLIEHWNGTKWSVVASPNVGTEVNELRSVAVVSASNVWAVGFYYIPGSPDTVQTLTEQWNGTSWSVVVSPNAGSSHNLLYGVAAVSASNVWTVGHFDNSGGSAQTLIEHWNGTKWSVVASPNAGSSDNLLYGVAAVSASNVWAVGDYTNSSAIVESTLTEHWNGTSWSVVASPNVDSSGNVLNGVAVVSASNVWAVGDYTNSSSFNQTLTEFYC